MLGSARLGHGSGFEGPASAGDLTSAVSRRGISPSQYESPMTFGSSHSLEDQYDVDSIYLQGERLNGYGAGIEGGRFNGGAAGGSTALYHHHGSRYGLSSRLGGPEAKMNGLHGPKHKRGEIDRKFAFVSLLTG